MTNEQVILMYEGLKRVDDPEMEPKVNYAVSRNIKLLEPIVDAIRSIADPKKEFKDYVKKQQDINVKHAKKDEKGDPKTYIEEIAGGRGRSVYDIPGKNDPNSSYSKEMKKLSDEYKDAIEKRKKQIEDYNSMVKEECQEKIRLIKISSLSIPKVSRDVMDNALYYMIDDSDTAEMKVKKGK